MNSELKRLVLGTALAVAGALALPACGGATIEAGITYTNALTGEACTPDASTFIPNDEKHFKPEKQEDLPKNPTGMNGDNMDDASSGRTDCLWDGNSGHGDDWKHPECFPRPGCDAEGCCEDPDDDDSDTDSDDDADDDDDSVDDPGVDCSALDDECGVGVWEPDSGTCYYLPNGLCVDDDGGDSSSSSNDDPSDPNGPSDPSDPNGPSDPSDPNGPTDPSDPSGPTDPSDCSALDDACGVGVYEPDTQTCYYLPTGLCSNN